MEVYDPETNNWSRRANMPTGRSGIAAAAVGGELWVFGGETPQVRPEVEAYNPVTNTWRRVGDMPLPRHGIWAAVIGNRIFLPAGSTVPNYGSTNEHDVFVVNGKATLANISSRLKVETGDNVLIAGFIVTGTGSKRIVVRGIGPSRGPVYPFGDPLSDPELELYNGAGELVAANNNWQDAPNRQEIIETTLAPTHDAEAAILTRLEPGNHTAVVRGVNGSTGIALVEVYDLEAGSESKPANISTRGFVQTDENVLIGGLILTGSDPTRVVVRAIGPSLQLPGRLENPTLELFDSDGGLIAANDDWRSSQQVEIIATQLAPAHDRESAIVRTLAPGSYTAIVRGAERTSGVGLVEAYSLD